VLIGFLCVLVGVLPATAQQQQATWLDGALEQWNSEGMAVPRVTPGGVFGPDYCLVRVRSAAGPEESALTAVGWQLTPEWPTTRRGDMAVVMATEDFDGMCRPSGFNAFVFVAGRFAGTIAPEAMGARSDGQLFRPPDFAPDGRLDASFLRYASFDPLCCPSRPPTRLLYRVEQREAGPVLIAERPAAGGTRLPSTGWATLGDAP
jgi:hypothetical protein